jgi:hypothetical protein
MVKFREVRSGLIYEYDVPYDIEQMRKHPGYAEVMEAKPEFVPTAVKETTSKLTKE